MLNDIRRLLLHLWPICKLKKKTFLHDMKSWYAGLTLLNYGTIHVSAWLDCLIFLEKKNWIWNNSSKWLNTVNLKQPRIDSSSSSSSDGSSTARLSVFIILKSSWLFRCHVRMEGSKNAGRNGKNQRTKKNKILWPGKCRPRQFYLRPRKQVAG